MEKVNITLALDDEKLDALTFSLRKKNDTVQQRMEKLLTQLYESEVPEPVREYLDSKTAPAAKPKRPPKKTKPQAGSAESQYMPAAIMTAGDGVRKEEN